MPVLKKLTFAPLFLIVFVLLIYQLSDIFKSYDFIFSLSLNTLFQLIILCLSIFLSSFLFILFSSLAFDWRFILPIGILDSLTPLMFFDQITGLIFGVGIFVSLLISYFGLENTMKSYITFQPITLFGPLIRHLSGLLIIAIAIVYFLVINKTIVQKGFELPDSLIKGVGEDQIQSFIKPFLGYVPFILALLLFLTLQSLTSLINLLIYPLLLLTFFILEKTGFVKFTTEMRQIKKLVV